MCNVYDIDSRKHLNRLVRFFFGMCGRRREKEIFLISKPRNKLSKKEVQYGTRNNLYLQEETPLKQK